MFASGEKISDGFQASVSSRGNLCTRCADFLVPQIGDISDIDFLVSKAEGQFQWV